MRAAGRTVVGEAATVGGPAGVAGGENGQAGHAAHACDGQENPAKLHGILATFRRGNTPLDGESIDGSDHFSGRCRSDCLVLRGDLQRTGHITQRLQERFCADRRAADPPARPDTESGRDRQGLSRA